jgi:hypothetical protein
MSAAGDKAVANWASGPLHLEAMLTPVVRAAAAQMGPTQRADTSAHVLHRMLKLLDQAAERGVGFRSARPA